MRDCCRCKKSPFLHIEEQKPLHTRKTRDKQHNYNLRRSPLPHKNDDNDKRYCEQNRVSEERFRVVVHLTSSAALPR